MNGIKVKTRAFTIFEMMVTILLSLILFNLLYFSYQILLKQLDRGKGDLSDILRVKVCLDNSIEKASQITIGLDRINFITSEKSKCILLQDTCILYQTENMTDTIYKGKYSYRTHENPDLKLTDAFYFEFYTDKNPIILNARKIYLPSIWLRRKEVDFEY
jgi:hypothetical protein